MKTMKKCDICSKQKPDVSDYEIGKDTIIALCNSCKSEMFPTDVVKQPKCLSYKIDKEKLVNEITNEINEIKTRMSEKIDCPRYTAYDAIGDYKIVRALKSLIFNIESGLYDCIEK